MEVAFFSRAPLFPSFCQGLTEGKIERLRLFAVRFVPLRGNFRQRCCYVVGRQNQPPFHALRFLKCIAFVEAHGVVIDCVHDDPSKSHQLRCGHNTHQCILQQCQSESLTLVDLADRQPCEDSYRQLGGSHVPFHGT